MDESMWQTFSTFDFLHNPTSEFKQYCQVWNTAQQCGLGLFQDSDFAGDSEDSKSTSGGIFCIFGSHTLVPISWMCKKQIASCRERRIKPKFQPSMIVLNFFILITCLQTSNFRSPLRCCTFLKTVKQWSRWFSREEARQRDMFPEPTELLLIGCLRASIWIPRFRYGTLTPNTRWQTYWQKDTSHVTNGIIFFVCTAWPGGWGPQGMCPTGGGGLVRVPNLRVCKHFLIQGGTCRVWRMTLHPAVVPSSRRGNTSSESRRRESRAAPQKGKWPYGDDSPHLSLPNSQPCFGGSTGCAWVTGKAGENGQNSGEMSGSSPWTRPSAPVWWHTQGSSGRPASDPGWGSSSKTAPGSLSTGTPASRTSPHGDGSQCTVRATQGQEKCCGPPIRALASVIVVTEKVMREADGPVEKWLHRESVCFGWRRDRPGVRLESRTGEPVRSPKITSDGRISTELPWGPHCRKGRQFTTTF